MAAAVVGAGGDQKLDGQLGSNLGTGRANSLALSALTLPQAAASSTTSDINSMTPSNKNPSMVAVETAGNAAGAASGSDCPDWESWGDEQLQDEETDTVGGLGNPSAKTPGVTPAHDSVNHAEIGHVNTSLRGGSVDAPRYGPPFTARDAASEPYAQGVAARGGEVLVAPDSNRARPSGEMGDSGQVKGPEPIPAQPAIIDYI